MKEVRKVETKVFSERTKTLLNEAAARIKDSLICNCNGCDFVGLRCDGKSDGRLRLKCRHCQKSQYADQHPDVLAEIFEKNPSRGVGLSQKSILMYSSANSENPELSLNDFESNLNISNDNEIVAPTLPEENVTFCHKETPERPLAKTRETNNAHLLQNERNLHLNGELSLKNVGIDALEDLRLLKEDIAYLKEAQKGAHVLLQKILQRLDRIEVSNNETKMQITPFQDLSRQKSVTVENHVPKETEKALWSTVTKKTHKEIPKKPFKFAKHNRFAYLNDNDNTNIEEYSPNKTVLEFINSNNNNPKKTKLKPYFTEGQLERILKGWSAQPSSPMVVLYFEGLRRTRIRMVKDVMIFLGVKEHWIRNISYVGSRIMELITFDDVKDEIILKLQKKNINLLKDFDPLSVNNVRNSAKFSTTKSNEGLLKLTKNMYVNRLKKTLEDLPKTPINNRLCNFQKSRIEKAEIEFEILHKKLMENGSIKTPDDGQEIETDTNKNLETKEDEANVLEESSYERTPIENTKSITIRNSKLPYKSRITGEMAESKEKPSLHNSQNENSNSETFLDYNSYEEIHLVKNNTEQERMSLII
jgi:hypothetical protein